MCEWVYLPEPWYICIRFSFFLFFFQLSHYLWVCLCVGHASPSLVSAHYNELYSALDKCYYIVKVVNAAHKLYILVYLSNFPFLKLVCENCANFFAFFAVVPAKKYILQSQKIIMRNATISVLILDTKTQHCWNCLRMLIEYSPMS